RDAKARPGAARPQKTLLVAPLREPFPKALACVNMLSRMRRPTMADKLSAFEVFTDRELKVGHPIVARLVGRKFDQLLEAGAYDRPYDAHFGKALVKTLSYVAATLGASFGFCERTEMSLFALANGG